MTIVDPIQTVPPRLLEAIISLVECVCAELSASGAGPPCWCGIFPGSAVTWDYCGACANGNCGMGYVRVVNIVPYEIFPTAVVDLRCVLPLAVQVEIGALRCLPQNEDGEGLSPDQATEAAMFQLDDTFALWRAIRCCGEFSWAVGAYQPVGPDGGCVGGFWTAWFPVD